jgi:chromosome segregation ATPase
MNTDNQMTAPEQPQGTPTPRTDHVVQLVSDLRSAHPDVRGLEVVDADFARTLERELAEALRCERQEATERERLQIEVANWKSNFSNAIEQAHNEASAQSARLAEVERNYYDVADAITRESSGPADLCQQARALRARLAKAEEDSRNFEALAVALEDASIALPNGNQVDPTDHMTEMMDWPEAWRRAFKAARNK